MIILLRCAEKQVKNKTSTLCPHSKAPEETVLEIKRQSLVDLQKVISQTEQKSDEILLREREKYQRLIVNKFEEAYALPNRHDGPEV